ncbi:MAG: ribbon-helix-helix domain-containing protein [Acidobacteriia bacterium]|nr:ribbon-helix-helix domain-containing protein [Terriglobia bacterium]
MSSQRITIRISESLVKRLKKQAGMKRRSESALVREALENYLGETPTSSSAYDLAKEAGLIGCVRCGPSDLSTNRKYFKGFGESR